MIGAIVAAVMAASFFLPWVEFFGESMGPAMIFDDGAPPIADMPWQALAFFASFAIAALAAVLALLGRAAGALMLIAGAIPFGLIAQQAMTTRNQVQDLGLPLPSNGGDPAQAFDMMREFMAIGLPAYFISAALLVVIGMVRMVSGR